MNAKTGAKSVTGKLKKWMVAGVAAVMALAWTITSLILPSNAVDPSTTTAKEAKIITTDWTTLQGQIAQSINSWTKNNGLAQYPAAVTMDKKADGSIAKVNDQVFKPYPCKINPDKATTTTCWFPVSLGGDHATYTSAEPAANLNAADWRSDLDNILNGASGDINKALKAYSLSDEFTQHGVRVISHEFRPVSGVYYDSASGVFAAVPRTLLNETYYIIQIDDKKNLMQFVPEYDTGYAAYYPYTANLTYNGQNLDLTTLCIQPDVTIPDSLSGVKAHYYSSYKDEQYMQMQNLAYLYKTNPTLFGSSPRMQIMFVQAYMWYIANGYQWSESWTYIPPQADIERITAALNERVQGQAKNVQEMLNNLKLVNVGEATNGSTRLVNVQLQGTEKFNGDLSALKFGLEANNPGVTVKIYADQGMNSEIPADQLTWQNMAQGVWVAFAGDCGGTTPTATIKFSGSVEVPGAAWQEQEYQAQVIIDGIPVSVSGGLTVSAPCTPTTPTPKLSTALTGQQLTGQQLQEVDSLTVGTDATLTDRVTLENLDPNTTYEVTSEIYKVASDGTEEIVSSSDTVTVTGETNWEKSFTHTIPGGNITEGVFFGARAKVAGGVTTTTEVAPSIAVLSSTYESQSKQVVWDPNDSYYDAAGRPSGFFNIQGTPFYCADGTNTNRGVINDTTYFTRSTDVYLDPNDLGYNQFDVTMTAERQKRLIALAMYADAHPELQPRQIEEAVWIVTNPGGKYSGVGQPVLDAAWNAYGSQVMTNDQLLSNGVQLIVTPVADTDNKYTVKIDTSNPQVKAALQKADGYSTVKSFHLTANGKNFDMTAAQMVQGITLTLSNCQAGRTADISYRFAGNLKLYGTYFLPNNNPKYQVRVGMGGVDWQTEGTGKISIACPGTEQYTHDWTNSVDQKIGVVAATPNPGGFTVTKNVVSEGYKGNVAENFTFGFTVNGEKRGKWVLNGKQRDDEYTFTIKAGETAQITGLPADAKIKVNETKHDGAELKWSGSGDSEFEVSSETVSFSILEGNDTTVALTATNTYKPTPYMKTTATDDSDRDKHVDPTKPATIRDTITYGNLEAGQEYKVSGELMDGQTATGIKAEKTFTAEGGTDKTVTLRFELTADQVKEYAGKKLTAYEKLTGNGVDLTHPEDPNNVNEVESQSIYIDNYFIIEKQATATDSTGKTIALPEKDFKFNYVCLDKDKTEGKLDSVTLTVDSKGYAKSGPIVVNYDARCYVMEDISEAEADGYTLTSNATEPQVSNASGGEIAEIRIEDTDQVMSLPLSNIKPASAGEAVTFHFDNTYKQKDVKLNFLKKLHDADNLLDEHKFTMSYVCRPGTGQTGSIVEGTKAMTAGVTTDSVSIPYGYECFVWESAFSTAEDAAEDSNPETTLKAEGVSYERIAGGLPIGDHKIPAGALKTGRMVPTDATAQTATVTVTAENTYLPKDSGFQVVKEVTGLDDGFDTSKLSYTVEYTCTYKGGEAGKGFLTLTPGVAVSGPENLKVGTTCTIKETGHADADKALAEAGYVPVDAGTGRFSGGTESLGNGKYRFTVTGETVKYTVTNAYKSKPVKLLLTKTNKADNGALSPEEQEKLPKEYIFKVTDNETGAVKDVSVKVGTPTDVAAVTGWTLKANGNYTIEEVAWVDDNHARHVIKDGKLAELNIPNLTDSISYAGNGVTDNNNGSAHVTLGKYGTSVTAAATDTFTAPKGELKVLKTAKAEGPGAAEIQVPNSFKFNYSCELPDKTVKSSSDPVTVNANATEATLIAEGLPVGTRCTITEDPGNKPAGTVLTTSWSSSGTQDTGNEATITVNAASTFTVEYVNTYSNGPTIATQAKSNLSGADAYAKAGEEFTIKDTVSWTNLPAGDYVLKGTLMDQNTGEPVASATGTFNVSEAEAEAFQGTEADVVTFTLDKATPGARYVVFEELFKADGTTPVNEADGTPVVHKNIGDKSQTVVVPTVTTKAYNKDTSSSYLDATADTQTVSDKVTFTGLLAGQTYTVKGDLHYQDGQDGSVVPGTEQIVTITIDDSGNATATSNGRTLEVIGHTVKEIEGEIDGEKTGEKWLSVDGAVVIDFTVSKAQMADHRPMVAYEEIQVAGGITIADHKDPTAPEQTVYPVEIATVATDNGTDGDHELTARSAATVKDTVKYQGLKAGETYTLNGELWEVTGEGDTATTVGEAPVATATAEVRANDADGEWANAIVFELQDGQQILPGKKYVVFEKLTDNTGKVIATHEEPGDTAQTVTVPSDVPTMGTTARDASDKDKFLLAIAKENSDDNGKVDTNTKIEDVIEFTGLPAGNYQVKAVLYDKVTKTDITTGELLPVEVTTEQYQAGKGTWTVQIAVPSDIVLAEHQLVVKEYLLNADGSAYTYTDKDGATQQLKHDDIVDSQTVWIPGVTTTATDAADNDHNLNQGEEKVTINDEVKYTGLIPGKEYTITGELWNKDTGQAIGGPKKIVKITPTEADGSVTLSWELDSASLHTTAIVAYEQIEYEGKVIAIHRDIDAPSQTVWNPSISTVATDQDGDHFVKLPETEGVTGDTVTTTVLDDVEYHNLAKGEYVLLGQLLDKNTNKVVATATSEPQTVKTDNASGTWADVIEFKNVELSADHAYVVFEKLYLAKDVVDGKVTEGAEPVAIHENINDADQTVIVPSVETTATDAADGDKVLDTQAETQTVADHIDFTGLLPGKTYTVTGELYDKETGEAVPGTQVPVTLTISADGKSVTATAEGQTIKYGTPTLAGNGTVSGWIEVQFTVAKDYLVHPLVAFETITYEGKEIAAHHDINDEAQTVNYEIGTLANVKDGAGSTKDSTGKPKVVAGSPAKVTDDVEYHNLNKGTYELRGTLVDKADGQPVATADPVRQTITKDNASGVWTEVMTFTFTPETGHSYVVFEELYLVPDSNNDGKIDGSDNAEPTDKVAEHKDRNDADQSVEVENPGRLVIEKVVADNTEGARAIKQNGVFNFQYVCAPDADTDTALTGTKTITITDGQGTGSVTVDQIPVGYQCAVYEVRPANADSDSWIFDLSYEGATADTTRWGGKDLDENAVLTGKVPDNGTVKVTAKNSYLDKETQFQVSKDVAALGGVQADLEAKVKDQQFNFKYSCEVAGKDQPVTGQFTLTAENGNAWSSKSEGSNVKDLKPGDSCTVTEVDPIFEPEGWNFSNLAFEQDNGSVTNSFTPNSQTKSFTFELGKDGAAVFTVKNVYTPEKGSFKVLKVVENPNGVEVPSNTFVFNVTIGDDEPLQIHVTGANTAAEAEKLAWTPDETLPIGTRVQVEELGYWADDKLVSGPLTEQMSAIGETAQVTYKVNGETVAGQKASFLIGGDSTVATVEADNSYGSNPAKLTIKKVSAQVTGDNPKQIQAPSTFKFTATCGGAEMVLDNGGEVALNQPLTIEGLKAGQNCTITEVQEVPEGAKGQQASWTLKNGDTVVKSGEGTAATDITVKAGDELTIEYSNEYPLDQITPTLGTSASVASDTDKFLVAGEAGTVKDHVTWTNLAEGTYTLRYELHDKADGQDGQALVNGNATVKVTAAQAQAGNGAWDIEIPVPADTVVADHSYVVYERLFNADNTAPVTYTDGEETKPLEHADINDEAQTVVTPGVTTNAYDVSDGDKHLDRDAATVKVGDKVDFTGLLPGKTYQVTGQLMYQDDNTEVPGATRTVNLTIGADGKVTSDEGVEVGPVTVDEANGTVSGYVVIVIEVDGKLLQKAPMVVFEDIIYEGRTIASHHDINDGAQTVFNPEIGTSAVDGSGDSDHFVAPNTEATIIDTVSWKDLAAGTYTVTGTLMDKDSVVDGKLQPVQGATAQPVTFTVAADESGNPVETNGTVAVTFTVPASSVTENAHWVVYEKLTGTNPDGETTEVAKHENPQDADQSVTVEKVPGIGTVATDAADGDKFLKVGADGSVKDVVTWHDLKVGKYVMSGVLMDKATGNPVDGKVVTKSFEVVAGETAGTVEMELPIGAANVVEGAQFVVFEKAYADTNGDGKADSETPVATHENINDADQTVIVPSVETTATDAADGDKVLDAKAETVRVNDRVDFTGLLPDMQEPYVVTGSLHVKEALEVAGETPLDAGDMIPGTEQSVRVTLTTGTDGTVTATTDTEGVEVQGLTGDGGNGTYKGYLVLSWDLDGKYVAKSPIVAFEDIKYQGREIAKHHDINDTAQTVNLNIGTVAVDDADGDKFLVAGEDAVVRDTVTWHGLAAGSYVMTGQLVDKTNGQPVAGVETQPVTFTVTDEQAKAGSGSVTVKFKVPASSVKADMSMVVFEEAYADANGDGKADSETPIAEHKDLSDKDQTVTVPKVNTTATDADGDHTLDTTAAKVTINDRVDYWNLLPGMEYTVTGELHFKDDIIVDGQSYKSGDPIPGTEQSVKHTPSEPNGSVTLTWGLDGKYVSQSAIVAFETVTYNGNDVAKHHDIDSPDQTVYTPGIETVAKDAAAGSEDHYLAAGEDATIIDTVTWHGLPEGNYVMTGTLMNKATGAPLTGVTNDPVKFTVAKGETEGTVEMTFQVAAEQVQPGSSWVVFEKAYVDEDGNGEADTDNPAASHTDIDDDDQTVTVPGVNTTATDKADGDKLLDQNSTEVTVSDKVDFTGLLAGYTYQVNGYLNFKSGPNAGKVVPGTEQTVNLTISEIAADGTVKLSSDAGTVAPVKDVKVHSNGTVDGYITLDFQVKGSDLQSGPIVAFETIRYDGYDIAKHHDINDAEQTTGPHPEIGTTATDRTTGGKVVTQVAEGESGYVLDQVNWKHLPAGTYTLVGSLRDKTSGDAIDGVVSEPVTFTVKEGEMEGAVEMTFEVPASVLADLGYNHEMVAFEYVYAGSDTDADPVASHADLTDTAQTVKTGDNPPAGPVTIDVNKVVKGAGDAANGKEFTVNVTYELPDGSTTDAVLTVIAGEKPATLDNIAPGTRVTFSEAAASQPIEGFEFENALWSITAGEDSTLGFVDNGDGSASFTAVNETTKPVTVGFTLTNTYSEQPPAGPDVTVATVASDQADGDKILTVGKDNVVVDKVTWTGLTAGTYTLKGTLMNKANGMPVEGATAEDVTFEVTDGQAQAGTGTVEMKFNVPAAASTAGAKYVAFEEIYGDGNNLVGSHRDINDAAQTVTVETPDTPPTPPTPPNEKIIKKLPHTGAEVLGIALAAGVTTILGLVLMGIRRRNGKTE
ncbi:MAG: VaFE repeat-containing surface-anchored protein [Varibaculum sp.]|nr:VaFE repeat-containing surface-anchored protein [Varibaculum sp.]